MRTKLSQALTTLIDTQVDSFEKLEIVIVLHRGAGEPSIAGLAAATNLERADVRRLVRELVTAGLIEKMTDSKVTLAPAHSGATEELCVLYEQDKATLAMAIAERSMVRLRNMAGRALAEAFVIRKKPGGNDG